jgi:diguanylate cyclase (GGDEF)-like protein
MESWHKRTLKSLFLPAGGLLLAAVLLLQGGFVSVSASAVDFFYYAVFVAGLLLAWRFQSSRILSALILLLVAHRALEFFSAGKIVNAGPGRIAFEVLAVLLPLNFVALAWAREHRLNTSVIVPRLGILFLQAVFVAVICRPDETSAPAIFHLAILSPRLFHWTRLPQPALLLFATSLVALGLRFLRSYTPAETGLFWSLAAVFAGMQAGGMGRMGSAYFTTAALILAASIVENSYVLAYHDELTTLPARRAFNQALPQLAAPYCVAVVDIDHFKRFNDTYGHDAGDQVLRMVASRLARVSGGGEAFRVGGEEFTILFPGKTTKETRPHLEALREAIQGSQFRFRSQPDRRNLSRGADRRVQGKKKRTMRHEQRLLFHPEPAIDEISVTISIGMAEPRPKTQAVDQVIEAADQALYRAKQAGRNRVEVAGANPPRTRARRASA